MNLSSASCMTGAKPLHIQIRLRVTDGDISLFAGTVPVNVRSLPTTSPTSLCPSVRRPLVLCAEDETFYRTNESGTRQRDRLECTWDSQLPALLLTATAPRWITYRAPNSLSLSSSSLSRSLSHFHPHFTISHFSTLPATGRSSSSSSSWLTGERRRGRGNDNSPTPLSSAHRARSPTRVRPLPASPETTATKQWRQSAAVSEAVRGCSNGAASR